MKDIIPKLIALFLSSLIFMALSVKLGWSKKLWTKINKKIHPKYNVALFIILCVPFFNILVQIITELMGFTYTDILNGAVLGFSISFLPNLGEKKL